MRRRQCWLLLVALLLAGCGQDEKPPPAKGSTGPPSAKAPSSAPSTSVGDPEKGRHVWMSQCVACHNSDPAKDGPVGPAVKGSSRELLEARVPRAQYPPGYKPKRDSKVMPPRPDLEASIPDLAAYLQ